MGTQVPGWSDINIMCLMIASSILGQYDRSYPGNPMGGKISDTFSVGTMAEFVEPFITPYNEIGLWGHYLIIDSPNTKNRVKNAIAAVYEEYDKLTLPGAIDENELELQKENLLLQTAGQLDDCEAICDDMGKQVLIYNRRIEMEEWR